MYDQSMVCEEHNFVVWWHARAACTSLKTWLLRLKGYDIRYRNHNGWEWIGTDEESIHEMVNTKVPIYNPNPHQGYFHFTVVRNPLARLASHYRQQVGNPAYNTDVGLPQRAQTYDTFRNFVRIVATTPSQRLESHVSSQSADLCNVPMDYVIRVRDLETEWPLLLWQLGLPQSPLPHLNIAMRTPMDTCCADWTQRAFWSTGAWPAWENYYDEMLFDLACQVYSTDLSRWYPEHMTWKSRLLHG